MATAAKVGLFWMYAGLELSVSVQLELTCVKVGSVISATPLEFTTDEPPTVTSFTGIAGIVGLSVKSLYEPLVATGFKDEDNA